MRITEVKPFFLRPTVLVRVDTDAGMVGWGECSPMNGRVVAVHVEHSLAPFAVGRDPFDIEAIVEDMFVRTYKIAGQTQAMAISGIEIALWDIVGKAAGLPVYKMLGAYRDKVPAYASTMCGDDLEGGLDTPEAYAKFALWCKDQGYPAFKLHTWQPPVQGAPNPKWDVAACAAVREAVGDEMLLMIDPFHYYSRAQSLYLGRELEKLGFHWIEEPMAEHSTSSYVWLSEQLDIPVVGPETAEGKMHTRAEWIVRGASDIRRGGVGDVGGITPLMKVVHLCEAFNVAMEVHGGGAGNLHVLCAMGIPGEMYERGLLHPFIDYDQPAPWLNQIVDPLDDEGYVHVSDQPGLGYEIDFDYIAANTVSAY